MTKAALDRKTSDQLLAALKEASQKVQSKDEVLEQRISFVLGSLNPGHAVTRAEIRAVLAGQDGK